MPANIQQLAASALRTRESGEATTDIVAIEKAIKGVGIFSKADVKRLKSSVGTVVARMRHEERRAATRRRR